MFKNITHFHRPRTLDEALILLKKGKVRCHAGGTGLIPSGSDALEGLVDLGGLDLRKLRRDDEGFHIEACVTLADLASWPRLDGPACILAQAALCAASTSLRNRITVGGSVAQPRPWSDLPPALLALDASIEVVGGAAGLYEARDFFARNPLDGASIVTTIHLPALPGGAAFHKVSRTRFDYSLLDVAVYLEVQDGRIATARIAAGCALPRAKRLTEAEEALVGRDPTPELLRRVAEEAPFDPLNDMRASAPYRKRLLVVYLQRCLTEALEAAKGGTN